MAPKFIDESRDDIASIEASPSTREGIFSVHKLMHIPHGPIKVCLEYMLKSSKAVSIYVWFCTGKVCRLVLQQQFFLGYYSKIDFTKMSARLMKEYKEAATNKDTDIRLTVHDNLYKWTAFIQGFVRSFWSTISFPEIYWHLFAGLLELLSKEGTSKFSLTFKKIIHTKHPRHASLPRYFIPIFIFVRERWGKSF